MMSQPDADGAAPPPDRPQTRPCLRCGAGFPSAWSGERICPACKRSKLWRDGASARSRPAGRRSG